MTHKPIPISVIILTYNEEDNIGRTLQALTTVDEVVLIDSGSTDKTQLIASEFPNVNVFTRPFDCHTNQWNYGHTVVKHDWVLSLDADYSIADELLKEIRNLDLRFDAYEASFRYCIYGQPLRSAVLPPRLIFYNRHKSSYIQDGHTQRLTVNGNIGKLKHPVFHDDRKPLQRWLRSQDLYTGLEIIKLNDKTEGVSRVDRLRKHTVLTPFLIFLYCLIIKGGVLEGRKGLFYAIQRLYAEAILVMKVIDEKLQRAQKS